MDISTFVILEDTLDELGTRRLVCEGNSRLNECVTVIHACMKLIAMDPTNCDYMQKIKQALLELSNITRQSGEFVIAVRLKGIAYRLTSPTGPIQQDLARIARTEP